MRLRVVCFISTNGARTGAFPGDDPGGYNRRRGPQIKSNSDGLKLSQSPSKSASTSPMARGGVAPRPHS